MLIRVSAWSKCPDFRSILGEFPIALFCAESWFSRCINQNVNLNTLTQPPASQNSNVNLNGFACLCCSATTPRLKSRSSRQRSGSWLNGQIMIRRSREFITSSSKDEREELTQRKSTHRTERQVNTLSLSLSYTSFLSHFTSSHSRPSLFFSPLLFLFLFLSPFLSHNSSVFLFPPLFLSEIIFFLSQLLCHFFLSLAFLLMWTVKDKMAMLSFSLSDGQTHTEL